MLQEIQELFFLCWYPKIIFIKKWLIFSLPMLPNRISLFSCNSGKDGNRRVRSGHDNRCSYWCLIDTRWYSEVIFVLLKTPSSTSAFQNFEVVQILWLIWLEKMSFDKFSHFMVGIIISLEKSGVWKLTRVLFFRV